jgi:hypothetical protein
MATELRLSVEQIATAIRLLNQEERLALFAALKEHASSIEESGWEFWDDAAEDIYNDLIPNRPANP